MADRVYIFDTTLRDGEQSPGATMSLQEKLVLAHHLETLGVDIIEAGFPAASQGDFEAVQAIAKNAKKAQVAGLCRAIISDIDRCYEAIKGAKNPRIHTFIATSDIHIKHKFNKSREEILIMAEAAVKHAVKLLPNVEFSAEDASRSDWNYLAKVCETVIRAGAKVVNIPDTVGYAQPAEFAQLIEFLLKTVPNAKDATFSVHCHNDLGLAVANTLAALKAGARQAELTLSGIGERAGNASIEEVVMALNTRKEFYNLDCAIDSTHLFPACRALAQTIGQPIPPYKPIIGRNAFAHESGIHQDGVLKNPLTYEIMTPASVGRSGNDMVIGKHSGAHAIKAKLKDLGYDALSEEQIKIVFDSIKFLADTKEKIFDEDVEAIILEKVYRHHDRYQLVDVAVFAGSQTGNAGAVSLLNETLALSHTKLGPHAAIVINVLEAGKVREEKKLVARGAGPVDALFKCIDQALGIAPRLEEYLVSAVTGGTDAQGSVLVRLVLDGARAVGRSTHEDILVASAQAYLYALNRAEKKILQSKAQ